MFDKDRELLDGIRTGVVDPRGIYEVLHARRGEVIIDLYTHTDKAKVFESLLKGKLINIELVRRLSDNKVFSIGDTIEDSRGNWKIDWFEFIEQELIAWNEEDGGGTSVDQL